MASINVPLTSYIISNSTAVGETMDIDKEREKIGNFIRAGLFTLSLVLLIGCGICYIPKTVATISHIYGERKLPIYCVNCSDKRISLSFDAAWGNEETSKILDILEKKNVKVTFFMTGGWIEKYPDDVKAIAAAGHDLGNHSETHPQMSTLSKAQCLEEIKKPHDKVKELTGLDMTLFRPPFGDYNNTLVDSVNESGYHCIQWDIDSLDWKDYGTESIIDSVCNNPHLGNGSIILCHNGAKYITQALEPMITNLQEQGYEIVPISQLIYTDDYYMDHEGRQFSNSAAHSS